MLVTILTLPLVCSILAGFIGRHIGRNGASLITIVGIVITFIVTIILISEFLFTPLVFNINLGIWIPSELFQIVWSLNLDNIILTMCFVVNFISGLVHVYSSSYMKDDPHLPRFMSYLSLFTFFMLILITGDNLIQLFLGWEGVGLCSFLLISFWTTRVSAVRAAIKALIVNRIADVALILGIVISFCSTRTVEFSKLFALIPYYINQYITLYNNKAIQVTTLLTIFLTVGAMGKSAQIFLHTWLPDAMEGPTPVSALIHAATMVTAGVFLIIKCSSIFEYTETTLIFLVLVGGVTALFSSTIGFVQYDIKKVIAYSTCSQLGYMVFICGLSAYNVSLFHLMNHAVFKALLFLSAGAIIHSLSNEQDMREMGGLTQLLPFVYATTTIGSLSLMGFPFLTGYYSKDLILEIAYSTYTVQSSFVHWLGTLTAFFTSVYSIRLIYLTFIRETRINKNIVILIHESPWRITAPLALLSIGSICLGYITKDLFIGVGSSLLDHVVTILPAKNNMLEVEFLPYYIKNLPFFWSIVSILSLICIYKMFLNYSVYYSLVISISKIHKFLNSKWYFDAIYNKFITKSMFYFSYNKPMKLLDKGILEVIGPYGVSTILKTSSLNTRKLHGGLIYYYAGYMLFTLLVLVVFTYSKILYAVPSISLGTIASSLILLAGLAIYLNARSRKLITSPFKTSGVNAGMVLVVVLTLINISVNSYTSFDVYGINSDIIFGGLSLLVTLLIIINYIYSFKDIKGAWDHFKSSNLKLESVALHLCAALSASLLIFSLLLHYKVIITCISLNGSLFSYVSNFYVRNPQVGYLLGHVAIFSVYKLLSYTAKQCIPLVVILRTLILYVSLGILRKATYISVSFLVNFEIMKYEVLHFITRNSNFSIFVNKEFKKKLWLDAYYSAFEFGNPDALPEHLNTEFSQWILARAANIDAEFRAGLQNGVASSEDFIDHILDGIKIYKNQAKDKFKEIHAFAKEVQGTNPRENIHNAWEWFSNYDDGQLLQLFVILSVIGAAHFVLRYFFWYEIPGPW